VPIVFLTHAAQMKAVTATVRDIDAMDFIVQPTVHMKIL
jgi:homoserine dehydrogenase